MFILAAIYNHFDGTHTFAKGQGATIEDCFVDILGEDYIQGLEETEGDPKALGLLFAEFELSIAWIELEYSHFTDMKNGAFLTIPEAQLYKKTGVSE